MRPEGVWAAAREQRRGNRGAENIPGVTPPGESPPVKVSLIVEMQYCNTVVINIISTYSTINKIDI